MKKTLKKQWVKALKSGKYLQARESLVGPAISDEEDEWGEPVPTGETGYCCLGVLCEIDPKMQYEDDIYLSTHPEVIAVAQKMWDAKDDKDIPEWQKNVYVYDKNNDETRILLSEDKKKVLGVYTDAGTLSPIIRDYYGLNKKVTRKKEKVLIQNKLVDLNDTEEADFNKIAKYLEKVEF
jgi:hypothetical protein